jgi:hypothetical protein
MDTIYFQINLARKDFEVSFTIGTSKDIYYSDLKSFNKTKNKYENATIKYIEL